MEVNEDAATNCGTAGGASSTHTFTGGQGKATSEYEYEVFLSFRGPDTREGFTDFLYTSLTDAGIRTFKDDEDLRKGEEFAPELLQAIEQSKILVPIFSKNYAASVWCLKEVAKMIECKKTRERKIIPIFYDVAPAEVRYQTGVYKDAFLSHESKKRYDQKTIENWKATLNAVGEIHGYVRQSTSSSIGQGLFVKTFTRNIFNELKKGFLAVTSDFVPVDKHVDGVMQRMGSTASETQIIGIYGMGGIGKTTIAKIIFNKFSHDFENPCFLSNIRETSQNKGIQYLQNQLVSKILKTQYTDIKDIDEGRQTIKDRLFNKRVLLLLDDVEEENHIDALVGNRDWLGEGSKIIITTRRKDVLNVPEVDDTYELTHMDPNQSLQLFSKHAFRRYSPLDEYMDPSNRAIGIAGGLPLALEVIGSCLCRTEMRMWDATLKMLESVPHIDIQSKLKISYDALNLQQKHIFLDIACLFIGYNKDILIYFWDEPGYFPEVAMNVLENMSLIKIGQNNEVWMHVQLRDFGRSLVHQESEMKIEKQTRVWNPKEAWNLLETHEEAKVEAFRLKLDRECQYNFAYEDFKRLSNLRLLEIDSRTGGFSVEERLLWDESPSNVPPTNVFPDKRNLLPHLRWLSWHHIPPTFDITKFSMENFVILDLSKSKITNNWKGWNHMEMMKNLKILNLTQCNCLKRTPIFSAHSNLEQLILRHCESLVKIDESICQLKRLVYLDVSFCENLQRLPDELGRGLASLEYLFLDHCKLLEGFLDTIVNLESLTKLDISHTMIGKLPDSIGRLKNLKVMKMLSVSINKIPDDFWTMEKAEEIDIEIISGTSDSDFHAIIDNCIYKNRSLRTLRLWRVKIHALPPRLPESLIRLELEELCMDKFPDLSNLTNLKELHLRFDEEYNGPVESLIPGWIGSLIKLESLSLSSSFGETTSPIDICLPPQLQSLCLRCPNLGRLPSLPSSLSRLCLTGFISRRLREDISNSLKFDDLAIHHRNNLVEIQGELPPSLEKLTIHGCQSLRQLPALSSSMGLRELAILHCNKLVEIQGELPQSLEKLTIHGCQSLRQLPALSSPMGLRELAIHHCNKLVEIQGELPQSLEKLTIHGCQSLHQLPALSSSMGLRELDIHHCNKLVEIQGELPQSLEKLMIHGCQSLHQLPALSSPMGLRELDIHHCNNLVEIQGELSQSLEKLTIHGCQSLRQLPTLSSSMGLRELDIHHCDKLVEIQGELPQSLEKLTIHGCQSLHQLPTLSSSMGLRELDIHHCNKLVEIQGELPKILEKLTIHGCQSLRQLPALSSSMGLGELAIHHCNKLIEIQGELPQSLEKLTIHGCQSLHQLPTLSSPMGLIMVEIKHCRKLDVNAIALLCSENSVKFVGEDDKSEGR